MKQPNQEPKLKSKIESISGVRFMRLSGRIDHTNASGFMKDLEQLAEDLAQNEPLIIDFTELVFITSAGLRALFVLKKELDEGEKKFAVTQLKGDVAEIFRITGFDALIPTTDTSDEAVALVSGS
ncbi:MAG: STAS domain-containing protein [Pseudomonadota bacterium]